MLDNEQRVDAGTTGGSYERVDRPDVSHLVSVLWRWKVLVAAGVVFFLGTTLALLELTPRQFEANKVLVFDQPALTATGDTGQNVSLKILRLMPTYATMVTSDQVLSDARERIGSAATLRQLRARVAAAPIQGQLALRITVRDGRKEVADRLTEAVAGAFTDEIIGFQRENGVPQSLRYVITPLQEANARQPARNERRTIVLVGLLGFAVMTGVAYVLEYVERN